MALESIDLRNGNNSKISYCSITNNINLICVFVDDANAPHNNWHLNYGTYVNNEVECDILLSANDFDLEKAISFYPNPINSVLFIQYPNHLNIQKIEIYDVLGKLVTDLLSGFDQISFKDVPSGLYFISIHTEYGTVKKKIIKI